MTEMRFSAGHLPAGPTPAFLELARRAEALEYDTLFVADHATKQNPYAMLAAAAVETDRIGLGTGVTNPYSRNPLLTAAAIATIDRLSGGQAQRAALGRALYSERPVLLADEPVSNLDEHQGLALIRRVLARHDTAVVAMHDRALALACFRRIIGLRQGELVLDAPATALDLADLDTLYR